jgi:hypothetical protein
MGNKEIKIRNKEIKIRNKEIKIKNNFLISGRYALSQNNRPTTYNL